MGRNYKVWLQTFYGTQLIRQKLFEMDVKFKQFLRKYFFTPDFIPISKCSEILQEELLPGSHLEAFWRAITIGPLVAWMLEIQDFNLGAHLFSFHFPNYNSFLF